MTQYIDKDALVAEIEKRRNFDKELKLYSRLDECNGILSFIDALEVKEVDLDKAIDDYIYTHDGRKRLALELDWKYCNLTLKGGNEIIKFAKHFFELGLFSQMTWQDIRLMSEIGEKFMNSEESDHLSEEEYYTEILNRFKAQKGE